LRSAYLHHLQSPRQRTNSFDHENDGIVSSKGNSIDKPQYEGNTIPSATDPSPSTLGEGFIVALAISSAPGGVGVGNVVALHSHLSAPVWILIQLQLAHLQSSVDDVDCRITPSLPATIRIRFWMRLPCRYTGGAVVTRQVSYFIAQCVSLNILLNLLNFSLTFLPILKVIPSQEANEQWPISYGCIRLAIDVGIGGVGCVEDQS